MFVSTDNCSTWLKLVILHLPFSLREEKQDEDDIKVSLYHTMIQIMLRCIKQLSQLFYASYPD